VAVSFLLGLIQILVIVFSEEPPVFSRTQGSQNTRPPPFAGGPTQTPYPSQAGKYSDSKKHRGHRKLNPSLLGHSTHFQIGGDNPKVEGQDFFYHSPGSGNRTLSQ
jgi:hypothetical protein